MDILFEEALKYLDKKLLGSRHTSVSVFHGKSCGTKRRKLQILLGFYCSALKNPRRGFKTKICGINKQLSSLSSSNKKRLRIRSEALFYL